MNVFRTLLIVGTLIGGLCGTVDAAWQTDLRAAQAQAKREGKAVFINFTGSDWCGWCIKLRNEVFSQTEFLAYAQQHLVLVEIDFPRRRPQSTAQRNINTAIASRYGIRGYPTVVLLNSAGEEIGRSGYRPGGAKPYVEAISNITGKKFDPNSAVFGGADLQPLPRYDDIKLKSITGKKRKLAMLNDRTFSEGEAARLRLGEQKVLVRCVKINAKSVVVAVNGEPDTREILLGN